MQWCFVIHALKSNFLFDCIKWITLVFLFIYAGLHRETVRQGDREGRRPTKRENCRPPQAHIRIAYTWVSLDLII